MNCHFATNTHLKALPYSEIYCSRFQNKVPSDHFLLVVFFFSFTVYLFPMTKSPLRTLANPCTCFREQRSLTGELFNTPLRPDVPMGGEI